VAEYGNAARDDVWRDPYATTVRVSEDRNATGVRNVPAPGAALARVTCSRRRPRTGHEEGRFRRISLVWVTIAHDTDPTTSEGDLLP